MLNDLKHSLKATTQSNLEKVDFVIENSPAMIYIFKQGKSCVYLTYANHVIETFTGLHRDSIINSDSCWLSLIHKDDRLNYMAKVRSLFRKKSTTVEYRLLNTDSTYHTVIDRLKVIDHNGEKEVIGSAVDITEHKERDRQLKMLALVAAKTSNAVVITDKDGLVEWVNDGFTRITGYSLKEMKGKKPGDILQGPDTDPATIERMHGHMKSLKPFTEEILNYTKEGIPYWLEVNIEPIFNDYGELEKFIAIETDITQRKIYEEKLISARKNAEEALKAKVNFLSIMSHEIRTPMNAVIGMANLLMDEIDEREHYDKLKTLRFSANHLLRLIDDILDFNKIESGNVQLEAVPFSLDQVLKGILSSIQPKVDSEKVQLEVEKTEDVPNVLIGDDHRLSQILLNLLSNAAKFTEHGFIQLVVEHLYTKKQVATLQFTVADSGIGIAKDRQEAIFESFQQATTDTTRKYGGTGLGLTIVKTLVELMGGNIKLKSRVGKGSTFVFTVKFPIGEQVESKTHYELHEEKKMVSGKHVLLVEDNRINQKVAIQFLSKWDVAVSIANNGIEALEKLKNNTYDCILMDLQMPVMDGLEATKRIRESENVLTAQTPIIALSASALQEIIVQAKGGGVNGFVTKPFKPESLIKAIVNCQKD